MDPTLDWWITMLAGAGVVAGLSLLARGLVDNRSNVRVADIATSTISSMAAGEVRISGVVEAAELTFVSLLQGMPCVFYQATIGRGGEVSPLESSFVEERSIGFRVRDATGCIRVFPRGARIDAPVRFDEETGAMGDEPPGLYNDQVYRYNTRIAQVPGALLAPLFGWHARELFAAEPSESVNPATSLRPA